MTTVIKRSLEGHEEIIESGLRSFLEVGRSLLAIRDERLWQPAGHKSFEAYCKKRWDFGQAHAYRLIESFVVVQDLRNSPIGEKLVPINEAQARALADSADDAKTRATVWKAAVASAPKGEDGKPKVTAAIVKKAAEAVAPKADKPAKTEPPTTAPVAEREPGMDELEPEHVTMPEQPPAKPVTAQTASKNGNATIARPPFDAVAIVKAYEALARLVDDMARSVALNNSPHHKEVTGYLSKSLDAFNLLTKDGMGVWNRRAK